MKIIDKFYNWLQKIISKHKNENAEDKLQVVFTGSQVDAKFIKLMLEDNGVPCLLKDPYNESVIAGWVTPGSEQGTQILVEQKNFLRASYLVDKHYKQAQEK